MRETFEPHRAAWHVLAILIGIAAVVRPPQGLAAIVDPLVLTMWAAGLFLSGVIGVIAPFRQSHGLANALALERAALWVQTGTLAWVVVSAIYYQGVSQGLGVAMYLAWIIANVIRDRRIASAVTKSGDPPGA